MERRAVDSAWHNEFRQRMLEFDSEIASGPGGVSLSIKVRVHSGCFHREHSPNAYAAIDAYLATHPIDHDTTRYVEHESGPEILLYVALTTAGLTLAKSVVDLITTIIKARTDGIKNGDHPKESLELIVRRIQKEGEYHEEIVLRFEPNTVISTAAAKKAIDAVLQKLPEQKALETPKTPKRKKR